MTSEPSSSTPLLSTMIEVSSGISADTMPVSPETVTDVAFIFFAMPFSTMKKNDPSCPVVRAESGRENSEAADTARFAWSVTVPTVPADMATFLKVASTGNFPVFASAIAPMDVMRASKSLLFDVTVTVFPSASVWRVSSATWKRTLGDAPEATVARTVPGTTELPMPTFFCDTTPDAVDRTIEASSALVSAIVALSSRSLARSRASVLAVLLVLSFSARLFASLYDFLASETAISACLTVSD